MVVDNLKNSLIYEGVHDSFKECFEFIKNIKLADLEPGRYEINGENAFALVQSYNTKSLNEGIYEAHKKYIDIQYIISGEEQIGYSNLKNLEVNTPYKEEADAALLKGNGNLLTLRAGDFAIFFPEDAHMPGISLVESSLVKKLVLKIKL